MFLLGASVAASYLPARRAGVGVRQWLCTSTNGKRARVRGRSGTTRLDMGWDDGKLFAGIYGENPRLLDAERDKDLKANPPAEKYPRTEGVYAEWIDASKGGQPAGSNFPGHSGPLTEIVLLGNLAVRAARTLELDPHPVTRPLAHGRGYRDAWDVIPPVHSPRAQTRPALRI